MQGIPLFPVTVRVRYNLHLYSFRFRRSLGIDSLTVASSQTYTQPTFSLVHGDLLAQLGVPLLEAICLRNIKTK